MVRARHEHASRPRHPAPHAGLDETLRAHATSFLRIYLPYLRPTARATRTDHACGHIAPHQAQLQHAHGGDARTRDRATARSLAGLSPPAARARRPAGRTPRASDAHRRPQTATDGPTAGHTHRESPLPTPPRDRQTLDSDLALKGPASDTHAPVTRRASYDVSSCGCAPEKSILCVFERTCSYARPRRA